MANANLNSCPAHPARHHPAVPALPALLLRPQKQPPLYPWIKLSGRWLELAGFKAGQRVRVEVQHGRLIITHD